MTYGARSRHGALKSEPTMARILADAPAVSGIEACRPGDPEVSAASLVGFLNEAPGRTTGAPADHGLRRRVGDTADAFTRLFA